MSVSHPKVGGIVWDCVKYHNINGKEYYKAIGLSGFYYKLCEEREDGGTREGLYWYHYLKHLNQLWPGDLVKQIVKMDEAFGLKNCFTVDGGDKGFIFTFRRQEFWKCIVYVLLAVTYGKKGPKLWSKIRKCFGRMVTTKIPRYVCGNTDLYKVCCVYYCHFYIYAFHFTQIYSFIGCLFDYRPLFISYRFAVYP